ncbi:uncharacterized protein LOC129001145 [Macrosteles quadrilineatus]|uniref:uncharacterized protein LOC129001145 n=1 Tax=Macrosteles quadrilineatus TaxID=74068 RepID=UPI0023E2593C|nr:uncharacterized protein LOC129001145 [Macrosteles quadrilineatus]
MPKEVPERCRIIPEDLTRKFPDCCPRLECPSKYQLSDEVRDDYQDLVTNLEFAMKRMVENEKIVKEEEEAEEKEILKKIIIQVIVASWLASEPHNRKSMRA